MNLVDKINVIYLNFATKLYFRVRDKRVRAQNIDSLKLDIFDMVINFFFIQDK